MGRQTIRASIVDYLQSSEIVGLTTVFAHPPKQTSEGSFIGTGESAGAVIYVHLQSQEEQRIAVGGPTDGMKMRRYRVALICVYRSKEPDTEVVGAGNDEFLDSLVAAIEANRAPSGIWQWGEGDSFGSPDISVDAGIPRTLRGQASQVWTIATVDVIELLSNT